MADDVLPHPWLQGMSKFLICTSNDLIQREVLSARIGSLE
jgi:hypothetical protein